VTAPDPNKHRAWCEARAARHLIQAQASLLLPTPENKANAMLFISLALLRLAESDPQQSALAHAERIMQAVLGDESP
jgi:hypothetical protein